MEVSVSFNQVGNKCSDFAWQLIYQNYNIRVSPALNKTCSISMGDIIGNSSVK